MSILVVDDELNSCEVLREILEYEGYAVRVARSGREAMAAAQSIPPALMILDLVMPGMSGNTLYEEMQKLPQLAKIPVLVTTADPTRAPAGVPTLNKPLRLDKLLALVALVYGRA